MKTTSVLVFLSLALLYSPASYADTFGTDPNTTFNIEFVTIGNPGNAADPDDGSQQLGLQNFGSVAETYRIGKFEISRDMIEKANTEGGLGITLIDMSSFGGNGPDKPATGVSWNEATRFVNWLNLSSGSPLAYKFAIQPGEGGYMASGPLAREYRRGLGLRSITGERRSG